MVKLLDRRAILTGFSLGPLLTGCGGLGGEPASRLHTLTIAIPSDPAGLEPATNLAEPVGSEIILNVFDTLVAWDEAEKPRIVPRLARDWRVAADGCSVTFGIRPGVRFHDGTPCDAAAICSSIERSLTLNAYLRASLAAVRSVTRDDSMTVTVRLFRPVPFLLALLAQPQAAIVSPAAAHRPGAGLATLPVGTGAFRLDSYQPDVGVVLVRNPGHFLGAARLERIVYLVVSGASTRRMMLERGEIDLVHQSAQASTLPMEDIAAFRRNPAIQVIEAPSQSLRQLEFNNLANNGPTRDIRVRQAIACAIDRDGLVDRVLAGTVDPAYGPLPSSNHAFDPTMTALAPRYDPTRARALLAAAGHAPGTLHFDLYTFQGSNWATVATMLQANLAEVGIDVAILQLEFPSLRAVHTSGRFQLALDGRQAWYDDPDAHITIGYLSTLARSAMTFRMPPDTILDRRIVAAQSARDDHQRLELYHELQREIAARIPAVYLFSNKVILFARRGIAGLRIGGAPPLTEYRRVYKEVA